MDKKRIAFSPFLIVASWLIFSVTLAAWWVIFAYRLLSSLIHAEAFSPTALAAKQRMLVFEGFSLILLLLAGGMALAYYIVREYRRNRQIQQFFAAFTHELKTPIASLRLQAEGMQEDLKNIVEPVLLKRMLKDTVRLELQLENSLYLSHIEELGFLHFEDLSLRKIIETVHQSWPELQVALGRECIVRCDVRAIVAVFKNLFNNALVHGKATKIEIEPRLLRVNRLEIVVRDNGLGFSGDVKRIGAIFAQHTSRSGSGIGLYLVKTLVEKMRGTVDFVTPPGQGFQVNIQLEGSMP